MGHYLDGEAGRVFVKMYKGKAMGISFPTDGNQHYESWITRFEGYGVKVTTHPDGELICIEVELPETVTNIETSVL